MKEPIAVITSTFFAGVSVVIAAIDPTAVLLIVSLQILAIASAVFHAEGSVHGTIPHRVDEAAMYAVVSMLVFHAYGDNIPLLFVLIGFNLYLIFNLDSVNSFYILPGLALVAFVGIAINAGIVAALQAGALGLLTGIYRYVEGNRKLDLLHGFFHLTASFAIFVAWFVTR